VIYYIMKAVTVLGGRWIEARLAIPISGNVYITLDPGALR
jgi:hypothetical protein